MLSFIKGSKYLDVQRCYNLSMEFKGIFRISYSAPSNYQQQDQVGVLGAGDILCHRHGHTLWSSTLLYFDNLSLELRGDNPYVCTHMLAKEEKKCLNATCFAYSASIQCEYNIDPIAIRNCVHVRCICYYVQLE